MLFLITELISAYYCPHNERETGINSEDIDRHVYIRALLSVARKLAYTQSSFSFDSVSKSRCGKNLVYKENMEKL